jgi:hypothetical protein
MKPCTKCKVVKPVEAFATDRSRPDGRAMWCRECRNGQMAQRNWEYRLRVLSHYSGGTMQCACCGEKEVRFLTIDHVDNDGAVHRRQTRNANIYSWIVRNGFPSGFGILCTNCNLAKGWYGQCPHQKNVRHDSTASG